MEALILSCSTGGGHNAAAKALKEEIHHRGHRAVLLDPYSLAGENVASAVGNGYLNIVKRSPELFGMIYQVGKTVDGWQRKVPFYSPVYFAQFHISKLLENYLQKNHFDVIITTHLYCAEMLSRLKKKNRHFPLTIFVATDYVCIPFTGETTLDYYDIPSSDLAENFFGEGIPHRKLVPFGIPVDRQFLKHPSKEEAKKALQLDLNKSYILLAGGSFGGGHLKETIESLQNYLKQHENTELLVLCGSNEKLLNSLKEDYEGIPHIHLLPKTDKMNLFLRASDLYISKAGGLSSTEACVANIPFIILDPIPGCETINANFFTSHGLALYAKDHKDSLYQALHLMEDPFKKEQIKENQNHYINSYAAMDLIDFTEKKLKGRL